MKHSDYLQYMAGGMLDYELERFMRMSNLIEGEVENGERQGRLGCVQRWQGDLASSEPREGAQAHDDVH